jgi:hypothetical protein
MLLRNPFPSPLSVLVKLSEIQLRSSKGNVNNDFYTQNTVLEVCVTLAAFSAKLNIKAMTRFPLT